jgi:DNA-directed RNA polymerase specialized sigma24 family protein
MLFYFDGKSAKKLADELEISHAGACTRLSRARRELRRIMERQAGSR